MRMIGNEGNTERAEIIESLRENAENVRNIYITLLIFCAYAWLTVESVTHEQLLKTETNLSLPIIGIALNVKAFFCVAPLLLFLIYLYFLLHVSHFSSQLHCATSRLKKTSSFDDWKSDIHSSMFTTAFLSPNSIEKPTLHLMKFIVLLSFFIIIPAVLYITFLKFLPYHDPLTSNYHAYLVLVSAFFSIRYLLYILKIEKELRPENLTANNFTAIWINLFIFLFPAVFILGGSAIGLTDYFFKRHNLHLDRKSLALAPSDIIKMGYKNDYLALLLQYKRLDLKERDLRYGSFKESDLTNVDLDKSNLEGANLTQVNLEGAELPEAKLQSADIHTAKLNSANLSKAHLEKADLSRAHLIPLFLYSEDLKDSNNHPIINRPTNLEGAHLEGADLSEAHLELAYLVGAHLEGAILTGAHLEGANLTEAHLEGASLSRAWLQGANLQGVTVDSTDFFEANLSTPSKADLPFFMNNHFGKQSEIAKKILMQLAGINTTIKLNKTMAPTIYHCKPEEIPCNIQQAQLMDYPSLTRETAIQKRIEANKKWGADQSSIYCEFPELTRTNKLNPHDKSYISIHCEEFMLSYYRQIATPPRETLISKPHERKPTHF